MAEQKELRIVEWPSDSLALSHAYLGAGRVPVALGFGTTPLSISVAGEGGRPFPIDMMTLLAARGVIGLCVSLCEAICVTCDYTIGVSLFDKPVMAIRIRGSSRFYVES